MELIANCWLKRIFGVIMSNRILITGLGLGADLLNGPHARNMDISLLLRKPQVLLWADKIIATEDAYKYVGQISSKKEKNLEDIVNEAVFNSCEKNNLFEKVNIDAEIDQKNLLEIEERVEKDLHKIKKSPILKINESELPGGIKIGDNDYCFPKVFSFYRSVYFAKKWNSQIVASQDFANYFSAANRQHTAATNSVSGINAFAQILSWKLPEFPLSCAGIGEKCQTCQHFSKSIVKNKQCLSKFIDDYIKLRNYDEIFQIRDIVSRILNDFEYGFLDEEDIVEKYREEEKRIRLRNIKIFKYADNLSNILFGASIFIPAISAMIPQLSVDAAAAAAVAATSSKIIDKAKEKYRKKTNWVCFKLDK